MSNALENYIVGGVVSRDSVAAKNKMWLSQAKGHRLLP